MGEIRANTANIGLNLSSIHSQKKEGELTFALNAQVEGLTHNAVTYQNEAANAHCVDFPEGYKVIGTRNILEKDYVIYMLAHPSGGSEIGRVYNNTCEYQKIINAACLGFNINSPIHKIVYKITNCSTEIYWTDGGLMRWMDLDNLPYKEIGTDNCDREITNEVDCNKLNIQPNFAIPSITYIHEGAEGELVAGTYQFAIQYSNSLGEGYTSYQGVTNPFSINDRSKVTEDFNYLTGKSITFTVDNIDITGVFDYINIAVVKTINNIPEIELVETRKITSSSITITYTGTNKSPIKLGPNEIFEKFPIYEGAKDIFTVRDILGWAGLTVPKRKNYQQIANKIKLLWQTYKLNTKKNENYSEGLNTATLRGYMRDEVYALSLVLTIGRGKETDAFPIPGPEPTAFDLEVISNRDTVSSSEECDEPSTSLPRWKVYNTAKRIDFAPEFIGQETDACYKGPYEYGTFGYHESTDTYPCDPEVWGALAGKPIRHHKFPDSSVTHIHDDYGNIFPIGIRIDIDELKRIIQASTLTEEEKREITGFKIVRGNRATNKSIVAKGLLFNVGQYTKHNETKFFPNYLFNDVRPDSYLSRLLTGDDTGNNPHLKLDAFSTDESKKRFTFHSPDTHFYQPTLGNELRIETIEYGASRGHFVEVKKHSRYKFLSTGAYAISLGIAVAVGVASMSIGIGSNQLFDGTAAFTSFVAITQIIDKTIPRVNFAYQHNAVGEYNSFIPVGNELGNKVRAIDISQYLLSGVNKAGDIHPVNNFQRESSVYIRTTDTLPFPHEYGAPVDESKWTLDSEGLCNSPFDTRYKNISSLYGSIKRKLANQYGTIDSYEIVDTGFHQRIDAFNGQTEGTRTVFGGDIFINSFAFKRKMPFFIDNRVGFPDDSDVFYNELGNVAYPTYWMSTDYKNDDKDADVDEKRRGIAAKFKQIFGVKINNFDCRNDGIFYQRGKFYLAAYGIPVFFCESEVNVDFRQAYNDKEGDFYPHAGESIPDDWLQEINVPIAQDNTYFYNKTFSKQNKESYFSRLPLEYKAICETEYPNKLIYSDVQQDILNYKKNNWLLYRPVSQKDLPLNYGKLISVEGMENKAILTRFENKSMIYDALLTIDTSVEQAAYLGNDKLFRGTPAIDFAETDLGYNGTQNKFFLRTEKGHISVDAKRGKVFIIGGNNVIDITDRKSNVEEWFAENLPFRISKYFPNVNTDNHFNNIGLHGVYDSKYSRLILTKLDYAPLSDDIEYRGNKFFVGNIEVQLDNPDYFCNKSFTISFDFDNARWISFHSYIPNFYVGATQRFYSGRNEFESTWIHNEDVKSYNSFYGITYPYILEYPFSYKMTEEILQSVSDNTKVLKYINDISHTTHNDVYFNKALVYNDQQCSGMLDLILKPRNNPRAYIEYPKYKETSKEILFTKAGNLYNFNMFWDVVRDNESPIFLPPCGILDKELNEDNMNYTPTTYKKYPIRGKDTNIRLINDSTNQYKFLSEFIITKTQPSFI